MSTPASTGPFLPGSFLGGPFLSGMSAGGRAVPVALLAALPGLVYAAGYDHLAYGLGILAGVVLAGVMIAPRIAAAGHDSLPSAMRDAFGPVAAAVAAILAVVVAAFILVAEFTVVGRLAHAFWGIAPAVAVAATLLLALALALVRKACLLACVSALAWGLLAAALIVPLVLIATDADGGFTLPHIAYGALLPDLQRIEEALVERGLVDFDTFSAHTAPFIRLIERDVIALVLTLACGIAVLPHLATACATPNAAAATRLAGAWAALFLMILVVSVPALAVYTKHAVYGAIVDGTPLANLPSWLEAPLESGLAQIHGTSLGLFGDLVAAVGGGARTAADVANALAGTHAGTQWQALDADVQQVMFAAAAHHIADPASSSLWAVYRQTVLPAAAGAAGNVDGTLMQQGFVIEPMGLLLVIPGLTGYPGAVSLLIAVAIPVGALAVAAGVLRAVGASVASLATGGAAPSSANVSGAGVALAVGIAAAAAALFGGPHDPVALAVSALALAAAGLFPGVALGLAWRRATAAGVTAAMIAGAAVTGYYMAATQLYPAAFYRTWSFASEAGEYAIEEFDMLAREVEDAPTDAARREARTALDEFARGSETRVGLANWAGIDSASSGIFGVVAGLVVLGLVSLVTPSSRRRHAS